MAECAHRVSAPALVVGLLFRWSGLSWGRSLEGGLLLGQGGEIAFIVVGFAAMAGLMTSPVAQFILLVVGLSLMITPILARWGTLLGDRLAARHTPPTHVPPKQTSATQSSSPEHSIGPTSGASTSSVGVLS